MTVIGMVVEGTNDHPILEAFLREELASKYSRPIKIRYLQPEVDATSGRFGGGGWGRVAGWCKANTADGLETYFSPIEDEDEPCDLILIQIDGDAMAHCGAHSSLVVPGEPCTVADRLVALENIVYDWVAPKPARKDQIRLAFPVMHSEAWLMAGLRPNVHAWELFADSKTPFRRLKPRHPKSSIAQFYKEKANEVSKLGNSISIQSQSFKFFLAELKK